MPDAIIINSQTSVEPDCSMMVLPFIFHGWILYSSKQEGCCINLTIYLPLIEIRYCRGLQVNGTCLAENLVHHRPAYYTKDNLGVAIAIISFDFGVNSENFNMLDMQDQMLLYMKNSD